MKQGQGIASVETAAALLKLLTEAGGSASLSELARSMGSTASKMHHYVSSLVRAGLVQQDLQSARYSLGTAALQMGLAALAQTDFMATAQKGLFELVHSTGHSGLLCVRGPRGVTIVRWQNGTSPVYTTLAVGSVLPFSRSANGLVFAAHLPVAALRLALKPEGVSAASLGATLEAVRAEGLARTSGGLVAGLSAVAAPVFSSQGEVVCSMALVCASGTPKGISPQAEKALQTAAARASMQLGYSA